MDITGGRLFLTALTSLEKVEMQYVPNEMTLDRTANVADIFIVGRNNPVHQYTSGNTELTFELDFHAEDSDRADVLRKVRMIQSWASNDGYSKPAELIRVSFGDVFKADEVWVLKRAPAKFSGFSRKHGFKPTQAYMSLQLALDTKTNRKRREAQWS